MDVWGDAFHYDLPEDLVAQFPLERRDQSRLLICDRRAAQFQHSRFCELPRLLRPGDLLVFNNTRVIPARLYAWIAETKKKVELLLLRERKPLEWECLAKPARALRAGTQLDFETGAYSARVLSVGEQGLREIVFQPKNGKSFSSFLEEEGKMPLPPYIRRAAQMLDKTRYQTIFARESGAVAAPTAGLHFTEELFQDLKKQEVETAHLTLHVGLGTFRPVGEKEMREKKLHAEKFEIPAQTAGKVNAAVEEGRRVIAVGSTTVRALESAAGAHFPIRPAVGETRLFIYPPFQFRVVRGLVTNFHLPRSSLLMLVAAFAGHDLILAAYKEAIEKRYRFYSYGDAMLIV